MTQQTTIGTHKTKIYREGEYTKVKYYNTDVVSFNDEEIILKTGGYKTKTTKTRMNQTSRQFNLGFNVYQKNWEWYVDVEIVNTPYTYVFVGDTLRIPRQEENNMDYIVGITEQELEFYYNRSTGLSNWSELMEEDKLKVIQEFNDNIRSYLLHLSKHMV
jgi:hypothetical protein